MLIGFIGFDILKEKFLWHDNFKLIINFYKTIIFVVSGNNEIFKLIFYCTILSVPSPKRLNSFTSLEKFQHELYKF